LPTYAEWNFAAAGGREQRLYAWGATPIDMNHAHYCLVDCGTIANVGLLPLGNGRYGQAELSGNAYEDVLDTSPLMTSDACVDCVVFDRGADDRGSLGGGWDSPPANSTTEFFGSDSPAHRDQSNGFRCARSP